MNKLPLHDVKLLCFLKKDHLTHEIMGSWRSNQSTKKTVVQCTLLNPRVSSITTPQAIALSQTQLEPDTSMQTICEFLRTHITDMKSFIYKEKTLQYSNTNHLVTHKLNLTWFCTVQQNNSFRKLELCKIAECNERNRYNIAIPIRAAPNWPQLAENLILPQNINLCLYWSAFHVPTFALLNKSYECWRMQHYHPRFDVRIPRWSIAVAKNLNALAGCFWTIQPAPKSAFATFIWHGCKQSKPTYPSWREHSFNRFMSFHCHDFPFDSHKSMTHHFLSCCLMSIF